VPLDLDDRTPREIAVRFEVSPRGEPGVLDRIYTDVLPARLEPDRTPGIVRLVIEGAVVEQSLLRARNPKPHSFSDFVWRVDAATGHVLQASLQGTLIETLDWGIARRPIEAHIRVRMSTRESGVGFRAPRYVLGQRLFRHCDARSERHCTAVRPVPFERRSGYVNAVGVIEVESAFGVGARTFSPLGEAVFLERPAAAAVQASAVDLP